MLPLPVWLGRILTLCSDRLADEWGPCFLTNQWNVTHIQFRQSNNSDVNRMYHTRLFCYEWQILWIQNVYPQCNNVSKQQPWIQAGGEMGGMWNKLSSFVKRSLYFVKLIPKILHGCIPRQILFSFSTPEYGYLFCYYRVKQQWTMPCLVGFHMIEYNVQYSCETKV